MKILYIYKDYFERRKIYGKYLKDNGHKVIYLEKKHKSVKNQIKIEEIKKSNPDLIWLLSPFYVESNPVVMDYIRSKKIPMVFYHGVSGRFPYTEWLHIWKQFRIIFSVEKDLHEYLIEKNIRSYHIPFGFHPTQYFKTIRSGKKYNVSFAGTIDKKIDPKKDYRCMYLNSLKNYKKVAAFGMTFKDKLHPNISVKKCKTHEEQRSVYSVSKINLELPFFSGACDFMKNKYHFKNRFFEIPATGNFLLSLRYPQFTEIFPEDTIGYYDPNIESFKESVDKYLKDKDLREKKAEKAYKLVHQKHTFAHRFKQMCNILKTEL